MNASKSREELKFMIEQMEATFEKNYGVKLPREVVMAVAEEVVTDKMKTEIHERLRDLDAPSLMLLTDIVGNPEPDAIEQATPAEQAVEAVVAEALEGVSEAVDHLAEASKPKAKRKGKAGKKSKATAH